MRATHLKFKFNVGKIISRLSVCFQLLYSFIKTKLHKAEEVIR